DAGETKPAGRHRRRQADEGVDVDDVRTAPTDQIPETPRAAELGGRAANRLEHVPAAEPVPVPYDVNVAPQCGVPRRSGTFGAEHGVDVPARLAKPPGDELPADRRAAQFGRVLDEQHARRRITVRRTGPFPMPGFVEFADHGDHRPFMSTCST